MNPRAIVDQIEASPAVPVGNGDRFSGYAVLGLPFCSGHVLAMRRFPASSVGPGYTSVWHRDPRGAWTFYSTVNPEVGCSRYFGGEVTHNVVTRIRIEWSGASEFTVHIGEALRWEVRLRESVSTRLINAVAKVVPGTWWQKTWTLILMGAVARVALGTGKINLSGKTPNGQEFIANPRRLWMIDASRASINGIDLGPLGALDRQARLNDFLIPQRGIFAVARAFLQAPRQG